MKQAQSICLMTEFKIQGSISSSSLMSNEQIKEFSESSAYRLERDRYVVYEKSVMRVAKREDLFLVAPTAIVEGIFMHVHGSSLTRPYLKHRKTARLRGRHWWLGWLLEMTHF